VTDQNAGGMDSAMYLAFIQMQADISELYGSLQGLPRTAVVAGMAESPSQADISEVFQNAFGQEPRVNDRLVNVDFNIEYIFTNLGTWNYLGRNPLGFASTDGDGIVKHSTLEGTVGYFVEGMGQVNGWDALKAAVAANTENVGNLQEQADGIASDVDSIETDLSTHAADSVKHITGGERTAWNAKYDKPSGGVPKTDLASAVQTSLGKADTALQDSNAFATAAQGAKADAALPMPSGSNTQFIDGTGNLQNIPAGLGKVYSTTEQATGDTWIDGKPIYRRAFTGTITVVLNTRYDVSLVSSGVDKIIGNGGCWSYNGTNEYISSEYTSSNTVGSASNTMSYAAGFFKQGNGVVFSSLSGQNRTNAPYYLWVEYTKP